MRGCRNGVLRFEDLRYVDKNLASSVVKFGTITAHRLKTALAGIELMARSEVRYPKTAKILSGSRGSASSAGWTRANALLANTSNESAAQNGNSGPSRSSSRALCIKRRAFSHRVIHSTLAPFPLRRCHKHSLEQAILIVRTFWSISASMKNPPVIYDEGKSRCPANRYSR